jgi:hypothetical protein
VHGYKGAGSGLACAVFMAILGDIKAMLLELEGWPQNAPPDVGRLAELCANFGITFVV